jgi:hypothetical protein
MMYQQEDTRDIFEAHRHSWAEKCAIADEGLRRVDPYLRTISYQGRVVWVSKGKLAAWLQTTCGDALVATSAEGAFVTIELKTERRSTGNLFIETWSNKSRRTLGWLWTLQSDLLCCYFLDIDRMYFVDFPALRTWLKQRDPTTGRLNGLRFKEVKASARQLNDTWGRLVPLAAITRDGPGYHTVSARQLEMFQEPTPSPRS